jgi:hypothetical protein
MLLRKVNHHYLANSGSIKKTTQNFKTAVYNNTRDVD